MDDRKLVEIAVWAAEPFLNKEELEQLKKVTSKLVIVPGEAGILGLALIEVGPQEITGPASQTELQASHTLPNESPEHIEPSNINGLEGQTIR